MSHNVDIMCGAIIVYRGAQIRSPPNTFPNFDIQIYNGLARTPYTENAKNIKALNLVLGILVVVGTEKSEDVVRFIMVDILYECRFAMI